MSGILHQGDTLRTNNNMSTSKRFKSIVSGLVTAGLLAACLSHPARAALLPTDAMLGDAVPATERERVTRQANRQQLHARLVALGVDSGTVHARVAGLTDDEAATLASRLDQLPAGGDTIETILIIFLVLLFTDILGLTDVFTFVNKPARR
jgi:hypothetical protein